MQPYDLVMLAVLAVTTLHGFYKGMAWQVASLSSLILSYVAALRLADQLAPHISAQAPWNKFIAMFVIYLATSAGIWMLFQFVSGMIERVQLKEFDRQVGGLFGLAKGSLLCIVITFFAVTLSGSSREQVLRSQSGGYIAQFIHDATPIMPPEVRQVLGPYLERLNRGLDPSQAGPGSVPATVDPGYRAPGGFGS